MSVPQLLEHRASSRRYGTTSRNAPSCGVACREPSESRPRVRYGMVYGITAYSRPRSRMWEVRDRLVRASFAGERWEYESLVSIFRVKRKLGREAE
jgi:hypothetical protein